MIRARWIGAAAITVALGSVVLVRACDPIVIGKPTDFSYAAHERPRVFVSHHPLIPASGGRAHHPAGARSAGRCHGAAREGRLAQFAGQTPARRRSVARLPVALFECRFSLSQSGDQPVYGGFLELSGGRRVDSRAEYRFSVRATIPPDTLIEVRVPDQQDDKQP